MNPKGCVANDANLKENFTKMKTKAYTIAVYLTLLGASFTQSSAAEIKVTLFGQPCLLQGPTDVATLKLIHSISPAEIDPTDSADLKRILAKIKSPASLSLPPQLDHYRESLTKRLEAQIAFHEASEIFSKTGKIDALAALEQKYFSSRESKTAKTYQAQLAKFAKKGPATETYSLMEVFNEGIEPDPEEEFHRAIHKINIEYNCSYDSGDTAEGA